MRTAVALILLGGAAHADPEPRLVGEGVVSTADDEFGGALSADGNTIYFSKSAPHSYRYVMVEARRRGETWTQPKMLPFSGRWSDTDPVLSPDGTKLLWASDRPVDGRTKHDYDLWMVERLPSGRWSAPRHLPAPINSEASEFNASMARDGSLYFSSTRGHENTGAIRVYRSRPTGGGWGEPEDLTLQMDGPGDTVYEDLDVLVDPDERYLVLGSNGRPEGLGHFDLYLSWNRGGKWSPPIHLPPPFNTRARDYAPHLSPDGKTLLFTSERGFALEPLAAPLTYDELVARLRAVLNGSGNLYQIAWDPARF